MAPHPTRRHPLRLTIATTALALGAALAPIGPTPSPAGARGNTGTGGVGCGATGASTGGSGTTNWGTTTGSTCGSNWVRFRSWGFTSDWVVSPHGGLAANIVDHSSLWGGADHKACGGCTIVPT